MILSNLGTLEEERGERGRAESLFREAYQALGENEKPQTRAGIVANLAVLRPEAGKARDAELLWRQALAVAESATPPGSTLREKILAGYASSMRRGNGISGAAIR